MNDHHFNIQIAIDFDIETSTFLNNMAYWLNLRAANHEHYYEGRYWLYNSYTQWTDIFPYWTEKQMRRIIDNCIKNGLLMKGNFNQKKYDNTNWYTLTDKALEYYPRIRDQILNTPAQTGKTPAQTGKTPAQTGRPIPNSKHNTKPDVFSHTQDDCEEFELELTLYQNPHQKEQACHLRKKCLIDLKCQSTYRQLPDKIKANKSYFDLLDECITYYATQPKPQIVNPTRFLGWINREEQFMENEKEKNKPRKGSGMTMDDIREA